MYFMGSLFTLKNLSINLRAQKVLVLPGTNSKSKGTNTNLYRTTTLWNSLNPELMKINTVVEFKKALKTWDGICKICRT